MAVSPLLLPESWPIVEGATDGTKMPPGAWHEPCARDASAGTNIAHQEISAAKFQVRGIICMKEGHLTNLIACFPFGNFRIVGFKMAMSLGYLTQVCEVSYWAREPLLRKQSPKPESGITALRA